MRAPPPETDAHTRSSSVASVARSRRRIGSAAVVSVIAIGLAVTWLASHQASMMSERSGERALAARASLIEYALRDRLLTYEAVLHAGVGLFLASEGVTTEEWRTFVDQLQLAQSYPGLQGLGFARRTQTAATDRPTSETNRDHTAIVLLEPLDARNRPALGFDMMSESVRRHAMERARDSGTAVLSGAVVLVQEITNDKQPGFLMYAPLYDEARIPLTTEERRRRLVGFVYCPFRAEDFLTTVLRDLARDVELEIFDSGRSTTVRRLFSNRTDATPASADAVHRSLAVLGHRWTLRVIPTPEFYASLRMAPRGWVWAVGTVATLLLAALVWALARSREHLSARLAAEQLSGQRERDSLSMLEQRVQDRTRELAIANRELHAANAQLEAFAQNVSHDLRAPLRAIEGYTSLLMDDHGPELSEDAREHLLSVMRNASKMQSLIDDMLKLAFVGRQPIDKRMINLWSLVLDVLGDLHKPLGTAVHAKPDELADVFADPNLLEHALRNLLSNAIKFTHGVADPKITIGSEMRDDERVFYVKDNGVGFDKRRAGRLFEVFHRLHRDQEFEGTGVGLTIVKNVIERHGGRIWADAEVGKGATFYFTLGDQARPAALNSP